MTVTVELSDKHLAFLKRMMEREKSLQKIDTIEDAVRECVDMAMFDDDETTAMQEGM